jgi:HK97 family phage prohead protease
MKKQLVNLSLKDVELSFDDSHEWRVKGYATRFNNVNSYGFKILAGAYADVIASGSKPKMFFNHDAWAVPIGYWDKLEENALGLKVEGVLTQGVAQAKDVYAALKAGTVDGLSVSIYFDAADTETDDKGIMSLSKIRKLDEISIVTADSKARITQTLSADEIDSRIESLETVRDLEAFLKDVANLSHRQSGWLLSKAKACFAADTRRDVALKAQNELQAIFERIQNI